MMLHVLLATSPNRSLISAYMLLPSTPTDGMARIFIFSPDFYAATGKVTNVSSVATIWRDLNSGRSASAAADECCYND